MKIAVRLGDGSRLELEAFDDEREVLAFLRAAVPDFWPMRMTRQHVADALGISMNTLDRRIKDLRFPPADADGNWSRAKVRRYVEGGLEFWEKRSAARKRAAEKKAV